MLKFTNTIRIRRFTPLFPNVFANQYIIALMITTVNYGKTHEGKGNC